MQYNSYLHEPHIVLGVTSSREELKHEGTCTLLGTAVSKSWSFPIWDLNIHGFWCLWVVVESPEDAEGGSTFPSVISTWRVIFFALIRLSATGFSLVDAWISYNCNGFKMAIFQVHPSPLYLLLCSLPLKEPLLLLYCAVHLTIPVPAQSHDLLRLVIQWLRLLHVWLVQSPSDWLYVLLTHPHHSLSRLWYQDSNPCIWRPRSTNELHP